MTLTEWTTVSSVHCLDFFFFFFYLYSFNSFTLLYPCRFLCSWHTTIAWATLSVSSVSQEPVRTCSLIPQWSRLSHCLLCTALLFASRLLTLSFTWPFILAHTAHSSALSFSLSLLISANFSLFSTPLTSYLPPSLDSRAAWAIRIMNGSDERTFSRLFYVRHVIQCDTWHKWWFACFLTSCGLFFSSLFLSCISLALSLFQIKATRGTSDSPVICIPFSWVSSFNHRQMIWLTRTQVTAANREAEEEENEKPGVRKI